MENPNNKIYILKEEMMCEFSDEIIKISEDFRNQYQISSQTKFCNMIGIDESSYRNLKNKRLKMGLKEKNMILFFLIYMLNKKEHQEEDFCRFFKEKYHHKIKEILKTSNWVKRKEEILNKFEKGDIYNENVDEKYDDNQQLETCIPPIVRNIIGFLKGHVACNIDIELAAMKYKKYFKCECIYGPGDEMDIDVLLPKIECIMVITHLQPDEEIRIIKENCDVDLFILIHNKKCQISEYQFFDGSEKSQEIEDKLILECVDREPEQLYILNDPEIFSLDNFLNSEIKINKSENMANYESEYSE